jgi:branched-chain amino acid transport system permease protein
MIGIYCLHVIGLNLLVGFVGQFNLGQAGFYGLGAYTCILLVMKTGMSYWPAIIIAGMLAGIFGIFLGPILKLRGHILAMATIAFGEIIRLVLLNWLSLTNGPRGIVDIPSPKIGGFQFDSEHSFFYLIIIWVIICYFIINRVINSRLGLAMRSIRDDQVAAEAAGVNVLKYKIMSLSIAAIFAGIAGALYAPMTGYLHPVIAHWDETVKIFTMVVIGGVGSIAGSILGAITLVIALEYLRIFNEYRLIVYGVCIIISLIFAPKGLWGLLEWFYNTVKLNLSSIQKAESNHVVLEKNSRSSK